ncbi:PTS system, fructose subfamily, IIA component domain protein, partial [Vibrio parahaemolyticus V-223/04]
LLTAQL